MVVLDLGSTPGAWSQDVQRRVGGNGSACCCQKWPQTWVGWTP